MVAAAIAPGRSVRVRVPATSANLGPGFDSLGLALNAYNSLTATASAEPGVRVDVRGSGAGQVPTDETNLIAASLLRVFEEHGIPAPGLDLIADNGIPHGRGMGSSAAAIVAGVLAAKGLLSGIVELDVDDVLRIATEIEGHPDNVAPAIVGGLTIAWTDAAGPRVQRMNVHRGVSVLLAVPSRELATHVARGLQPAQVPHEDAVFNVARAALLIAALTQNPEHLMAATDDRLHQGYRAPAMPETAALVRSLRDAGNAAVVSGAGPSVLVLCSDPQQRLRAAELVAGHDGGWESHLVAVDIVGGTVEELFGSEGL